MFEPMRFRTARLALLALLLTGSPALAQYEAPWGTRGVEISGFGGLIFPNEPVFKSGETPFRFESDQELLFGGRIGYMFPFHMFVEGEAGYAPLVVIADGNRRNMATLFYGGSLGYSLQVAHGAQLFVLAGGGAVRWDPDGLDSESTARFHFGGGARLFLTPSVAVRIEARDNVVPATLNGLRSDLNPGLAINDALTHNFEITGSVSLVFGHSRDSDGDGVADAGDACPDTPAAANVDAGGCPKDGDGDGVPDYRDGCPNTRTEVDVNPDGCALDSDGDGVANGLDSCPNTQAQADVDASGCARDRDGDGVPDGLDLCPNTLGGAMVDESGCAKDADGDGVADGLDLCPNTPPDLEVNMNGCSRIEEGLQKGRLILHDIYFDFGRATLRSDSRAVLDEIAQVLVDRSDLRIEIQGHTDSSGPADYNQRLSERRAQAVLDYLLTFPGMRRERFVVQGYGESQPITSNESAIGRQENRRVEFVVLNR